MARLQSANGVPTAERIYWLNFDNRTAIHNHFACTPSIDWLRSTAALFIDLNNCASEYRLKVDCKCGT